jgi:hypothetical protein
MRPVSSSTTSSRTAGHARVVARRRWSRRPRPGGCPAPPGPGEPGTARGTAPAGAASSRSGSRSGWSSPSAARSTVSANGRSACSRAASLVHGQLGKGEGLQPLAEEVFEVGPGRFLELLAAAFQKALGQPSALQIVTDGALRAVLRPEVSLEGAEQRAGSGLVVHAAELAQLGVLHPLCGPFHRPRTQ